MTDNKPTYLLRSRTEKEVKTINEFKRKIGSHTMKSILFDLMDKFNQK